MKTTLKNFTRATLLAWGLAAGTTAMAQNAICYNCPPEWADWGSQIKAIKAKTGITVPPDNKHSGQSLAQLVAEKASPVADVTYLGVTFAIQAQKDSVVAAYKPAAWAEIPDGLKDPAGHWFTIHSDTLGFMVNVDALKGKPVPQSWADLLKPDYKGLIGYLDPASAFVGYVGAVAVNQARGGTLDNFGPGIDYFKALQKNEPIVPKQTTYARVLSGEIAILLDYDFNAYGARHKDKANVAFVIPAEGTVIVPYVMSLVGSSGKARVTVALACGSVPANTTAAWVGGVRRGRAFGRRSGGVASLVGPIRGRIGPPHEREVFAGSPSNFSFHRTPVQRLGLFGSASSRHR